MNTETENKETVNNSIVTKETNIREVLKGAEGTLTVLEDYDATKAKLTALAKDLAPQVEALVNLDDFNTEQMAKAKEVRASLREPRYAVQNVVKHNTKTLNDAKSSDKKRLEALIVDVEPLEDKIDAKIKAIEGKRADEKKAKEDAERERVANINRKIADAGVVFERMLAIGKTEEDLKAFDEAVESFESKLEEDLEEYAFEGSELLEGVKARRIEISDRLDETNRVAEQAKENEGKAEELDKKEKELAAQARQMGRYTDLAKLGLIFNGVDAFIKEDFNVSTVEITADTDEEFSAKVLAIKNEMLRRENAKAQQVEFTAKFNALSARYKELTGTDYPELSVELSAEVLDTVKEVVDAKATELENAKTEELKKDGKIYYSRAVHTFEAFRTEVKIETLEDGVLKTELTKYVKEVDAAIERLRVALNQDKAQ